MGSDVSYGAVSEELIELIREMTAEKLYWKELATQFHNALLAKNEQIAQLNRLIHRP
jgi:hypothetical protein